MNLIFDLKLPSGAPSIPLNCENCAAYSCHVEKSIAEHRGGTDGAPQPCLPAHLFRSPRGRVLPPARSPIVFEQRRPVARNGRGCVLLSVCHLYYLCDSPMIYLRTIRNSQAQLTSGSDVSRPAIEAILLRIMK